MTTDLPLTYEQWFHCITVKCKTALTPEFARQRIAALGDVKLPKAVKFARLYGDAHRVRVAEWYRRFLSL